MMDDPTLLLRNIASGLILLYAAGSAAARIGLVPGRIIGWWHDNWLPAVRERERDERLDRTADTVDCIAARLEREFANGVGVDSPEYVPLRKALDAHVEWAVTIVEDYERRMRQQEARP